MLCSVTVLGSTLLDSSGTQYVCVLHVYGLCMDHTCARAYYVRMLWLLAVYIHDHCMCVHMGSSYRDFCLHMDMDVNVYVHVYVLGTCLLSC